MTEPDAEEAGEAMAMSGGRGKVVVQLEGKQRQEEEAVAAAQLGGGGGGDAAAAA